MKKILNILFIALFLSTLMSCEGYLDVNEDPNRATSADPDPLFVGATNQYSTNRVIDLGPPVSTAGQMWSGGGSLGAGVFTNPENYTFSIFTTGNTWRAHYRDIQKNLQLAIIGAQESGDPWTEAQCEIFSALTYFTTTSLWGDVPYSQAVDVDFSVPQINTLNPAFDPQQQVLRGVISKLDRAIALIDQATFGGITSGDLIYGGDIDRWRKLAKSLKFRTLMTLVDQDDDAQIPTDIAALIAEGDMISSAAENAEFPFFDESGNRNPFWETLNVFAGASNFFYFAAETMVETMKDKDDPRLEVYFTPYPGGGSDPEVMGAPAGEVNLGFFPWVLSTSGAGTNSLVRPDAPDVIFSYSEQLLLEAEAHARGFAPGGLSVADDKMVDGITAAMEYYGIDETEIDDYIDGIPVLSSVSVDEAREIIEEELWVDCIVRPVEGWLHWRRGLEVPALELPVGAPTAGLARRLPYPPDELAANTSAPMNLPEIDEKQWFDE